MIVYKNTLGGDGEDMVRKLLKSVVKKYDNVFCSMAHFAAPIASSTCRSNLYQPKEPDGLDEFAKEMIGVQDNQFPVHSNRRDGM